MSIEWRQTPAYWYGKGAVPADLISMCSYIYPEWSPITMGPFFQPAPSGNGWYVYAVGGNNYDKRTSMVMEAAPQSFIGLPDNATLPYSLAIMSIYFPKADRRWAMTMTITASGSDYNIALLGKWYKGDGTEMNDVVDTPGRFSANATWFRNTFGWPVPPGQFIVGMIHTDANGPHEVRGFTYGGSYQYNDSGIAYYQMNARMVDILEWAAYLQEQNPGMDFGVWETEDVSPEAGPASQPGGYTGYGAGGSITDSDSAAWPDMPAVSAASLGFINMYNPSANGLTNLGEEIFPDFEFTFVVDPTGIDIVDAILNAAGAFIDCINQVPKMFETFMNSRLIDYVQDCHVVPVQPPTTTAAPIKLGYRELNTSAPVITSEYVDVDLGTINLNEFFTTFLDYQPYTRSKLFLPFVGFVPLEPEYWQSGYLNIKYRFNVYDGSFMCGVLVSPNGKISKMHQSMIAQYAGTAIVHLPLTGLNYSSMVAGLVGGAGAMANAIGSGNPAAAAAAALNTATASPQVLSSNSYTASASFLGMRTPYILIERTNSHYPKLYEHDKGMPSKITTSLGSAKGFVTVKDVDLNVAGFRASREEKDEIRKLLSEGIYV